METLEEFEALLDRQEKEMQRVVRHACAHSALLRVPVVTGDGKGGVREIPPDEIPKEWIEEFLQAVQERGKENQSR